MAELPTVSGGQAIKAFEKHGFEYARKSGSHYVMKKPGHRYLLTVPRHGSTPLKPGTLRGLIDAAGMTVEQFVAALR